MPTTTLTNGNDHEVFSGVVNDGLVDTIVALDGNDTIIGNNINGISITANDPEVIYGGMGNDSIDPGRGSVTVFGDDGNDTIDMFDTELQVPGVGVAQRPVIILDGGTGDDSITGSQGDDLIYGGTGADTINSNFATPIIPGSGITQVGDTVYGGDGDDDDDDDDVITTD